MNDYALFIAAANTATVLTGGAVALLASRAFRRTGSAALRAFIVGFGTIDSGSVLGGGVHLLGGAVALRVVLQSTVTAVGFGLLLYSLYTETASVTENTKVSI